MSNPKNEHPRPQMLRTDWLCLNGQWDFEIDTSNSGEEKGFVKRTSLDDQITVPFCPESKLSGINNKDFMDCVWYKKWITIPTTWTSKRTILHIDACDYLTTLFINEKKVGSHSGGYASFSFDITDYLTEKENLITIKATDQIRSYSRPSGKQSVKYDSYECFYTRTTGIWQSVWLENVSHTHIENFKLYPDPDNSTLHIKGDIRGFINKIILSATTFLDGQSTGLKEVAITGTHFDITIDLNTVSLWDMDHPTLYDLNLALIENNHTIDTLSSYFGLRTISFTDNVMSLNHKPVFQRLVLDQGFYPDGIYTAPDDESLKNDILLSKAMGFNGARLHEKVFEPRFLYWADQLGYLIWGEHANWGLDIRDEKALDTFLPEWIDIVNRDFNHPSIVGWCPFNETWEIKNKQELDSCDVLRCVYDVTKQLDPTRPCIDTSGNYHVITDIFDIHDYEQDIEKFKAHYEPMITDKKASFTNFKEFQQYEGQPYFVSEYGGIKWDTQKTNGWGYGNSPKTEKEFINRYRELTHTLLDNPHICAFCYTQLYDVEQEVNGLYNYDRTPKFNCEVIKKINSRKAAIEK